MSPPVPVISIEVAQLEPLQYLFNLSDSRFSLVDRVVQFIVGVSLGGAGSS